jgi:hypothetical protein
MSCGELERLFAAGAPPEAARGHREACPSCAALGADVDFAESLTASLRPPAASPSLLASLLSIPGQTVSCEQADRLAAGAVEGNLAESEHLRLAFHRSRCPACVEAAAILGQMGDLTPPAPAPWLAGRIAARTPETPRAAPVIFPARRPRASLWRFLASPKGAISLAYASAVIVMLAGFNPADLARKAGVARLKQNAAASVQVARNSLADRLGAFEEEAMRKLEVWTGQAAGYTRAALSRAIQLVMRTESQPPPPRGKSGEEKGLLRRNEIETRTWRA